MLALELLDEVEDGPRVQTPGVVFLGEAPCLEYLISWHREQLDVPTAWCFVLADDWTNPQSARSVIYLSHGVAEDGRTAFKVSDADCELVRELFPSHIYLARAQVMGTAMAKELFQLNNFIWENDDRIAPIREWADGVDGTAAV
jgi:hypothetical protein